MHDWRFLGLKLAWMTTVEFARSGRNTPDRPTHAGATCDWQSQKVVTRETRQQRTAGGLLTGVPHGRSINRTFFGDCLTYRRRHDGVKGDASGTRTIRKRNSSRTAPRAERN